MVHYSFTKARYLYLHEPNYSIPRPPIAFFMIHFNILTSRSCKSLFFRCPHQSPTCTSLLPMHAICPANLVITLHLFTQLQIINPIYMQFSPASSFFLLLRPKYLPQLTNFEIPPPICFCLMQRPRARQYTATRKIIFFTF